MADRIAQLRSLLDTNPNDPFCLYGLAQEYAKIGDAAVAIGYYDRAIDADPAFCYAYFHKARVQEQDGDADGAVETLKHGLERAQQAGDAQAVREMQVLLDSIAE